MQSSRVLSLVLSFALAFELPILQGCASAPSRSGSGTGPASAGAPVAAAPLTETQAPEPELAPGFQLQLSSSQDTKINGTFRIQADGRIELPYDIAFNVSGMDMAKFKSELHTRYKPFFKGTPNITVNVKQKRYYVEVRGLVSHPGTYLVKRDSPLDEVISTAGGLTEDLQTGFLRVEQSSRTAFVDLNDYFKRGLYKDIVWVGGERLFFQKERPEGYAGSAGGDMGRTVQILGEVHTPGEQTHRKEGDIFYYLGKTGGPTATADLDEVEHIRMNAQTGEREKIAQGALYDIKDIRDGDMIIVHAVRETRTERFLRNTATVASIVSALLLTWIAVKK